MIGFKGLLKKHNAFIGRVKSGGGHVVSFMTPCCKKRIEDSAPKCRTDVWDTFKKCPHCGALFWVVIKHAGAEASLPMEAT